MTAISQRREPPPGLLRLTISDPPACCPPGNGAAPLQVWRDGSGGVAAYGYAIGERYWMEFPGLASYSFTDDGDEVAAHALPTAPRDWVIDTFYRSVLPMALHLRGYPVLHASAVRLPQGVVALCAASETGKSTLAYGLGRRGWELWADDAVALACGPGAVDVLPLPFRLRLRPASAAYYAIDEPAALDGAPDRQPLLAVCILSRLPADDDRPIATSRLAARHAFAALLTHAYCFRLDDLERKRQMLRQYLDLAARTPALDVRIQTGLVHLPAILDEIERAVQTLAAPGGRS